MTKGARARARAVREAEAERQRVRAARRARRRAIVTAPWRAVRALVVPRRHRTGRVRTHRDRAQLSAIVMGLLVAVLVVFLTIDSWALRIGAVVLALLIAPVLLVLTRSDYSRSVQ